MTSIQHDIWQDAEGLTSLCFAGDLGAESRTLLDPSAKIIHSFYASSHFEAMTTYYQFMDWGTYTTDFEIDKEPYNLAELKKRARVLKQIDIILWEDWDPLGVNDIAPRDEYRTYVHQMLNLVMNDATVEELTDKLFEIETTKMGLDGNKKACNEIAIKIKAANDSTDF